MTGTGRIVTIDDVARAAGVSRAAVSKVIRDAYGVSDSMRIRVETAITELGYRPRASARAMRGSSYTLGFEIPNIHNSFFPKLISGAMEALSDSRYQVIIAPGGPVEDGGSEAVQALADRQVDGIVAISPNVSTVWLETLAQRIPLVMIGSHRPSDHHDTVVTNDHQGGRLATQHLHELGHRRIVHLTIDDDTPQTPHTVRVEGYTEALQDLGLHPEILHVGSTQEGAFAACMTLLADTHQPVGIFAAHDELALGALQARATLGLSPGHVSVVGYDDIDIAAHPMVSLTSINQSGTRMGARAVELLLERIGGRTQSVQEITSPRLIDRASTAPAEPWPTSQPPTPHNTDTPDSGVPQRGGTQK